MKDAMVELGDNLITVLREVKIELGIIGKLACFFVDLFYGVGLVIGLEETISPGAHVCGWLVSAKVSRVRQVARCANDGRPRSSETYESGWRLGQ